MAVRRLFILVFVAAAIGVTGIARATADDAAHFINQLGNQAITTLRAADLTLDQRESRFRSLLNRGFDLNFIGRFVLGRYLRVATADQKSDYITLYGEYLLQTYTARLGGYTDDSFTVTGARQASEKDVVVSTTLVRPSGLEIAADWRVRVLDGKFRIIDVMVEGISMAVTQRSEFAAVVQRDGIEGLLAILRAWPPKYSATAAIN